MFLSLVDLAQRRGCATRHCRRVSVAGQPNTDARSTAHQRREGVPPSAIDDPAHLARRVRRGRCERSEAIGEQSNAHADLGNARAADCGRGHHGHAQRLALRRFLACPVEWRRPDDALRQRRYPDGGPDGGRPRESGDWCADGRQSGARRRSFQWGDARGRQSCSGAHVC